MNNNKPDTFYYSETENTVAMNAAITACRNYYQTPGNETGGSLHIILDDGNVEDGNLWFCLSECVNKRDFDGVWICSMLLRWPIKEREELYGRYQEYAKWF